MFPVFEQKQRRTLSVCLSIYRIHIKIFILCCNFITNLNIWKNILKNLSEYFFFVLFWMYVVIPVLKICTIVRYVHKTTKCRKERLTLKRSQKLNIYFFNIYFMIFNKLIVLSYLSYFYIYLLYKCSDIFSACPCQYIYEDS